MIASSLNLFCNLRGIPTAGLDQPARRHGDASYITTRLITATEAKNYMAILLETRRLITLEDIIGIEPKKLTTIFRGRNITDKNTSTINSDRPQPAAPAVRPCPWLSVSLPLVMEGR